MIAHIPIVFLPVFLFPLIAWPDAGSAVPAASISIEPISSQVEEGWIEIQGVRAGPFEPALWREGTLNWVPDARFPLLEPLPGRYRNIYAPSALEVPGGWRIFYGAWDGAPTGNDRIYSAFTSDFLLFQDRHTVIEHNRFTHVCNVNTLGMEDGSIAMMCTVYPDDKGLNKPAFFSSPDGIQWNGTAAPYAAQAKDIVVIHGYNYPAADINGMNVLLREEGVFRLYFCDFRDFGRVYRATGVDGRRFEFEGKVLEGRHAVNDVKKFRVGEESWYLMGMHLNGNKTWYSLSPSGLDFTSPQTLLTNRSEADRYIVSLGWVVQGGQEQPGRRLLGVLYGAGHDKHLASNRIFALWLQKKLVLVREDGKRLVGMKAHGPNRQRIETGPMNTFQGRLEVYDDDGLTLLGRSHSLRWQSGGTYLLSL